MAAGDKWEMGVAAKVANRKFRAPVVLYASTSGVHAIGSTTLTLQSVSYVNGSVATASLSDILKEGDMIRVKPSSGSSSTDSERLYVRSVSALGVVTLQEATTVAFADQDDVLLIGHGMPDYWTISAGLESLEDIRAGGDFDTYKVGVKTNTTDAESGIIQVMPSDAFPHVNAIYRLGFVYKLDNGGYLRAKLKDYSNADVTASHEITGSASTEANWTRETVATSVISSGVNTPSLQIIRGPSDSPETSFDFALSELWLEHAIGTTGFANGVYQLPYYPDEVSVNVQIHTPPDLEEVLGGRSYGYETFFGSGAVKLHTVVAKFTGISAQMANDLKVIERWWKKGFLITLHPFMRGLPDCLVGRVTFNWPQEGWDDGLYSVEMVFQEICS